MFVVQSIRSQEATPARITYSQFIEHLDEGNIHKVVFRDRAVEGEFRVPATIEGQEYSTFESMTPGDVGEGLLGRLSAEGVIAPVRECEPSAERRFVTPHRSVNLFGEVWKNHDGFEASGKVIDHTA